jgi:hypothetical protein
MKIWMFHVEPANLEQEPRWLLMWMPERVPCPHCEESIDLVILSRIYSLEES